MRLEQEDTFPLLALNPELVNIITLGHKGLYTDFSYFWLLHYLIREDQKEPLQKPEELYRKIKVLTRHQPKIESLYTLSCFVMALDYKQPHLCEEIAEDGMTAMPKSWLIPAIVGYMFAFDLKDQAKASFYYKKTENLPNSPPYLAKLSKRLLEGEMDKKDGEEALRAIIQGTDDKEYKEFLNQFLNQRKQD